MAFQSQLSSRSAGGPPRNAHQEPVITIPKCTKFILLEALHSENIYLMWASLLR